MFRNVFIILGIEVSEAEYSNYAHYVTTSFDLMPMIGATLLKSNCLFIHSNLIECMIYRFRIR